VPVIVPPIIYGIWRFNTDFNKLSKTNSTHYFIYNIVYRQISQDIFYRRDLLRLISYNKILYIFKVNHIIDQYQ
jgi:hypothetical protein